MRRRTRRRHLVGWVVVLHSAMASIIMVSCSSSSSFTVSAYVGVSSSSSFSRTNVAGTVLPPPHGHDTFVVVTPRHSGGSSPSPTIHRSRHHPYHHGSTTTTTTTTTLCSSGNNESEPSSSSSSTTRTTTTTITNSISSILDIVGLLAQPIVWISLLDVSTTGGGLPEGPYGVVGALEGLSYLTVVGWATIALVSFWRKTPPAAAPLRGAAAAPPPRRSERVSLFTMGIGLFVLVKLVNDQGCIPNATPILDYSAYVNVCLPHSTTRETLVGWFGGDGA